MPGLLYRVSALTVKKIFFGNIHQVKIDGESSNDLVDYFRFKAVDELDQGLTIGFTITPAQLNKAGTQCFNSMEHGWVLMFEQYVANQFPE